MVGLTEGDLLGLAVTGRSVGFWRRKQYGYVYVSE